MRAAEKSRSKSGQGFVIHLKSAKSSVNGKGYIPYTYYNLWKNQYQKNYEFISCNDYSPRPQGSRSSTGARFLEARLPSFRVGRREPPATGTTSCTIETSGKATGSRDDGYAFARSITRYLRLTATPAATDAHNLPFLHNLCTSIPLSEGFASAARLSTLISLHYHPI